MIKNLILSKSGQFNHYKNKTEELTKEIKKTEKDNEKLKNENKKLKSEKKIKNEDTNYKKGISIIIPSYKGENHIKPLLDSLSKQTLDKNLYEIIFVINGEMDSTINLIKKFISKNPDMNILMTYTTKKGVCNARNIGINLVKREYTGFIDDDDFISNKYLEKLYEYSKPNRVVMSDFVDVNEKTGELMESPLVPKSQKEFGVIKKAPVQLRRIATITPAKSIPTSAIKSTKFNTELKNGVDISYYTRLYPKYDFEFYLIDRMEKACYYRLQRSNSISRQKLSYEFNILDRLAVIKDINKSYNSHMKNKNHKNSEKYKTYLKNEIKWQVWFMKNYLKEHPKDKEKVLKEIEKYDFTYFDYDELESYNE